MDKTLITTKFESYDPNKGWYTPDHDLAPMFIGNVSDIDWQAVIEQVQNKSGVSLPQLSWDNPSFGKIKSLFENSSYNMTGAEWINYYSGTDYSEDINAKFGQLIGKPKYAKAWISRLDPGKTAPWHWDLNDDIEQYIKQGSLVRYVCKMNKQGSAQVTIIGNNILHDWSQGDVYQWPDYNSWHGSINAGFEPKYQFNYLAYV